MWFCRAFYVETASKAIENDSYPELYDLGSFLELKIEYARVLE